MSTLSSSLLSKFITLKHATKNMILPSKNIIYFNEKYPYLGNAVKYTSSSLLIGNIKIYDGTCLWYNTIVRGDKGLITIGFNTIIQDRTTILSTYPEDNALTATTYIGNHCNIGRGTVIEGAHIEDYATVGNGCVVSKGSMIERKGKLDHNSVLKSGDRIMAGQLWSGNPAKFVRDLETEEKEKNFNFAQHSATLMRRHIYETFPLIDADRVVPVEEPQKKWFSWFSK